MDKEIGLTSPRVPAPPAGEPASSPGVAFASGTPALAGFPPPPSPSGFRAAAEARQQKNRIPCGKRQDKEKERERDNVNTFF